MDDEIELKKFDMKTVGRESVCCFIAPRRSGKSFLIKDLLFYHQNIPAGVVISKTDKLTHFYDKFIPPVLIHDHYDPDIIDKIFARQIKALDEKWPKPECLLIFDDTLSEARVWKNDPRIEEIFFNGRHYKIMFLFTMQAPMAIPSSLRGNIDFTFIFQTNNVNHRKNLYENYAGIFRTREIFEKVLDACTEDYGCLVINNTIKTHDIQKQAFYYKAKEHDEYRLCSNSYWLQVRRPSNTTKDTKEKSYNLKGNKKITVRKL